MLRPLFTALLGVALCLAGGTFDTASLYVPGVGLVVLSLGAVVWVQLAARKSIRPARGLAPSSTRGSARVASEIATT